MSDFALQSGQTVVFAGDSITDCGRRGNFAPFGEGYVHQAIDLITTRYPERDLRYFNEGIGGNTVIDLEGRWHDDVLRHKPDWVTIKIGINDIHRGLRDPAMAVTPEQYEKAYRTIVGRTRESGAKVVLIDPFYISTETHPSSFRSRVLNVIGEYIGIVRQLAREFETLHVPTHDLYAKQLEYRPPDAFCPEPVHPNASGHFVLAHGLLRAWSW